MPVSCESLGRFHWYGTETGYARAQDGALSTCSEEEYQAVGHLGRGVMISLAQAVIDPAEAIGEDGKPPSSTDAARLLDADIGQTLSGGGNEALRRVVRGVVKATSAVLPSTFTTLRSFIMPL